MGRDTLDHKGGHDLDKNFATISACLTSFFFHLLFPSADPQEGLGWYLLGRCYMAAHKHELAYAAYEQAV